MSADSFDTHGQDLPVQFPGQLALVNDPPAQVPPDRQKILAENQRTRTRRLTEGEIDDDAVALKQGGEVAVRIREEGDRRPLVRARAESVKPIVSE